MAKRTIEDILEESMPPRAAISLMAAPLSTTSAEFYDILLDRWRSGERSPALADAIKRGSSGFDWVQVFFVDDTIMSAQDWGGNGVYQVNGPDLKSCRIHGHIFSQDEICPDCKGDEDAS